MLLLQYTIWNPSLELLRLGPFAVRWYSLMIILTFLGGNQIARYIFRKTGKVTEEADELSLYVLCGSLIGARAGEIFFYRFSYYLQHPVEAILPISFTPHFHFTGYQGLSYHGALLGGLAAIYLYANYQITFSLVPWRCRLTRRQKKRQSFLWLSTPLALGILMGFFVRIGNFINSEIIGTPTHNQYGVLFARHIIDPLQAKSHAIESIKILKGSIDHKTSTQYQPIILKITFKNIGLKAQAIQRFIERNLKEYLVTDPEICEHLYQPPEAVIDYKLTKNRKRAYIARINTFGIPRHPVQLYESFSYILVLLLIFSWWYHKYKTLPDGVIAGTAAALSYSFRFLCEFFKAPFNILIPGKYPITMGHMLSLLTVLGGIALIIYAYTHPQTSPLKREGNDHNAQNS